MTKLDDTSDISNVIFKLLFESLEFPFKVCNGKSELQRRLQWRHQIRHQTALSQTSWLVRIVVQDVAIFSESRNTSFPLPARAIHLFCLLNKRFCIWSFSRKIPRDDRNERRREKEAETKESHARVVIPSCQVTLTLCYATHCFIVVNASRVNMMLSEYMSPFPVSSKLPNNFNIFQLCLLSIDRKLLYYP